MAVINEFLEPFDGAPAAAPVSGDALVGKNAAGTNTNANLIFGTSTATLTDNAILGAFAGQFTGAAGVYKYLVYNALTAKTKLVADFYVDFTSFTMASATEQISLLTIWSDKANGSAVLVGNEVGINQKPTAKVAVTVAGTVGAQATSVTFKIIDVLADGITTVARDTSASIPLSTARRFRLQLTAQPGGASGLNLKIYYGSTINSDTAVETLNGAMTSSGSTTINQIRVGPHTGFTGTIILDDLKADDTNSITRVAAAVFEDFEGTEAEGTSIRTANTSIFANDITTYPVAGSAVFSLTNKYSGTKSAKMAQTANTTSSFTRFFSSPGVLAPKTEFWVKFDIYVPTGITYPGLPPLSGYFAPVFLHAAPGTSTSNVTVLKVYAGTNVTNQFKFAIKDPGGTNGNIGNYYTTDIACGEWHEVAWYVKIAGSVRTTRLKIYSGNNRAPGQNATIDDGIKTYSSNATFASIDALGIGSTTAANLGTGMFIDNVRVSDGPTEPATITYATPGSPVALTATGTTAKAYSPFSISLVPSGGTPPYNFTTVSQTAGTATPLTYSSSAPYVATGTAPASKDGQTLTYSIKVTDSAVVPTNATVTGINVVVSPHSRLYRTAAATWAPYDEKYRLNTGAWI